MANYHVLYEVTPSQLLILRPAILKLWDFRMNASTPVTMEELNDWAHSGEFAVALRCHESCANVDDVFRALVTAPSDAIAVVGTVRQVTVYRAKHTLQMLMHIGCPSFLWDRSKRIQEGAIAQDYFHIQSKSFQPATLGQRVPRFELGKDVLTYMSTAFVAPEAEGTGLRHQLSYGKLVRNMPQYCHAARLGYRIFLTTTLYDQRGKGLSFANSFLQLGAKLARDVGKELGLGAALSFNVVHWAVQSCWGEDATVVVACIDPTDGFDIDSSYMYTSPRGSSMSTFSSRGSSFNSQRNGLPAEKAKWWNWPKRLVKSIFHEQQQGHRRRDTLLGDRTSRF